MGPFEQESRSDTGEVEAEAVEHALHAPLDEARQMVACLAEHFQFQRDRMCSVACTSFTFYSFAIVYSSVFF